jgi:hypothetical protein
MRHHTTGTAINWHHHQLAPPSTLWAFFSVSDRVLADSVIGGHSQLTANRGQTRQIAGFANPVNGSGDLTLR